MVGYTSKVDILLAHQRICDILVRLYGYGIDKDARNAKTVVILEN